MSASTASEWLIGLFNGVWRHLAALGPAEIAINAGLSALIVAIAFGLGYGLKRLLARRMNRIPSGEVAEEVRHSRAVQLGQGLFKLALVVGAAWLVLAIWGFDPAAWAQGSGGSQVMRLVGRLALIVVAGLAAFEFAGFAIDRGMKRLAGHSREPRRAAQVQTLAPIIKGIVRTGVAFMVAMMALSEIGIRIGPLLAGAGVVGVAIGFGAQTLVKDFLTGLFFVLEDIVSVGDNVRIGEFSGQVESMTLRTIRLRDFDGTLHVFPYGEAQVVHNNTKGFSFAVVDLQVALDADIDDALTALREVGEAMVADPAFARRIVGPVEVLGTEAVSETGVRLRARIKTAPKEDPAVQREFYRRLKTAFDAKGVHLPSTAMRLVMPTAGAAPATH